MCLIKKGQFFLDKKSCNIDGQKPKYHLVLTDGKEEEDKVLCLVLNSEKHMDKYKIGCNKSKQKYIISPETHKFSFLKNYTSIILMRVRTYFAREFYEDNLDVLKDFAEIDLMRQIKNCLDENNLLPNEKEILKNCYKIK